MTIPSERFSVSRFAYRSSAIAAYFVLTAATCTAQSNSTDSAMYFHSQVQDAPQCAMSVVDGELRFPAAITNAAATCPDAFGWMQMLEAIGEQFWEQWGNDETLWVSSPKPLCESARDRDCCFVNENGTPQVGYRDASGNTVRPSDIGGPGEYCPYVPGDYGGSDETTFQGGKPVSSHNTTFLRSLDPARIARQQEVEVVYRNDPFMRYTTAAELYSQEGLQKLFSRVAGEAANAAPYRPTGKGASYPPDAVMFKVDWIGQETMLDLGYIADHDNDDSTPPQDKDHPYVTMKINASTDNGKTYTESLYYLVGVTGASKALPNWHWYAFEHVSNLGRCDFTGCNDSYGFSTTIRIPVPPYLTDEEKSKGRKPKTAPFESNFIRPAVRDDQLQDNTSIFVLGGRYPSGKMSSGLAAAFNGTGIGGGSARVDPDMPKTTDPAWRSYRLKGTQTQFYHNDGYPTVVGQSVTEGGFVNTASCMSCHVQASVDSSGAAPGVPGVGATGRLNLFGIGTVVNGAPYTGDFYDRGTTLQRAVQTDFVWGVLFAEKGVESKK